MCSSCGYVGRCSHLRSLHVLLSKMRVPPQSLHALLWRLLWQMLAPPQSLLALLSRLLWQMLAPPQSLHVLLSRLCSQPPRSFMRSSRGYAGRCWRRPQSLQSDLRLLEPSFLLRHSRHLPRRFPCPHMPRSPPSWHTPCPSSKCSLPGALPSLAPRADLGRSVGHAGVAAPEPRDVRRAPLDQRSC